MLRGTKGYTFIKGTAVVTYSILPNDDDDDDTFIASVSVGVAPRT